MEYFVTDLKSRTTFPYYMHLINSKWPKTRMVSLWFANSNKSNIDFSHDIYRSNYDPLFDTNVNVYFSDIDPLNPRRSKEIEEKDNPQLYKEMKDDVYDFINSFPIITTFPDISRIYEAEKDTYYHSVSIKLIVEIANLKMEDSLRNEYAKNLFREACKKLNYEVNLGSLCFWRQQSFNNRSNNCRIGKCVKIHSKIRYPINLEDIYIIRSKDKEANIKYSPGYIPSKKDLILTFENLLSTIYTIHQEPINLFISSITSNENYNLVEIYNKANNPKHLKNLVL